MVSSDNQRLEKSASVRPWLACQSDNTILGLLTQPLHQGLGGDAFCSSINGLLVFIKAVPLTATEQTLQNYRSTKNIFNLPTFYQYGVGSTGFGAWRELAAWELASSWVESGLSLNFPILYHWRELHYQSSYLRSLDNAKIAKDVSYWNNSESVRERLLALRNADTSIVLIAEYFSLTLQQWFSQEILAGESRALAAIEFVEQTLATTNSTLALHRMIHFDAHFRNIVTDGNQLVLSDFGLAMVADFALSNDERHFFDRHKNYDHAMAAVSILHCVLSTIFDNKTWHIHLANFLNGDTKVIPTHLRSVTRKYGDVTLLMNTFLGDLQNTSKLTAFPDQLIAR